MFFHFFIFDLIENMFNIFSFASFSFCSKVIELLRSRWWPRLQNPMIRPLNVKWEAIAFYLNLTLKIYPQSPSYHHHLPDLNLSCFFQSSFPDSKRHFVFENASTKTMNLDSMSSVFQFSGFWKARGTHFMFLGLYIIRKIPAKSLFEMLDF